MSLTLIIWDPCFFLKRLLYNHDGSIHNPFFADYWLLLSMYLILTWPCQNKEYSFWFCYFRFPDNTCVRVPLAFCSVPVCCVDYWPWNGFWLLFTFWWFFHFWDMNVVNKGDFPLTDSLNLSIFSMLEVNEMLVVSLPFDLGILRFLDHLIFGSFVFTFSIFQSPPIYQSLYHLIPFIIWLVSIFSLSFLLEDHFR